MYWQSEKQYCFLCFNAWFVWENALTVTRESRVKFSSPVWTELGFCALLLSYLTANQTFWKALGTQIIVLLVLWVGIQCQKWIELILILISKYMIFSKFYELWKWLSTYISTFVDGLILYGHELGGNPCTRWYFRFLLTRSFFIFLAVHQIIVLWNGNPGTLTSL